MGAASLIFSMSDILKTFTVSGSTYFTIVSPYQPEFQQMIDLDEHVPFCGVEHVLDELSASAESSVIKRDHRFALHVIMAMDTHTQPANAEDDYEIKMNVLTKAEVRDDLVKFIMTTLANTLNAKHDGIRLDRVHFKGEDLIFTNRWAEIEGGTYMAMLIELTVKGVREDLT